MDKRLNLILTVLSQNPLKALVYWETNLLEVDLEVRIEETKQETHCICVIFESHI